MYQVISATTAGKAYNLTYEIIANTLTGGGSFRVGVTNGAEFVGTTTLSTDVGVHNYTLIADGGTWIAFNTSSGYTGGALTLDNVSLTRSGAVAEYDGSGAGHGQWLDKSGNELHGDVSGASLENTGANHTEKYVDLTVTGDTSFTLPKGYRVSAVTTKETAGNALGGGMDIGTTNGGGEVVAAHAISANTTAIATIVAAGSIGGTFTTADDTLYITDADGTGWDSASVEVRVEMQRLTMN